MALCLAAGLLLVFLVTTIWSSIQGDLQVAGNPAVLASVRDVGFEDESHYSDASGDVSQQAEVAGLPSITVTLKHSHVGVYVMEEPMAEVNSTSDNMNSSYAIFARHTHFAAILGSQTQV
ncbi:uncharacterized protein BCR38DRAFT_408156 [Pseudomassariella vexata]|uniref:Uncharacterized protein n=1 Tax=Pseudomassariella vexata TaxID=1141098 RepID=A0A1Y2E3U1_9PEZI|nr:uncharacterized protein BCR38DRAFT_408156 [Pseudomassariella vexata]ORY66192.1 hypothetical protein BCR38DRAFT_408156 [Pseudomassariella vexata]